MNGIKEEFINKFRDLLNEYNASIYWECDAFSDVSNVYNSHLEIDFANVKEVISFETDVIDTNCIDSKRYTEC